jgi:hypothetical protein
MTPVFYLFRNRGGILTGMGTPWGQVCVLSEVVEVLRTGKHTWLQNQTARTSPMGACAPSGTCLIAGEKGVSPSLSQYPLPSLYYLLCVLCVRWCESKPCMYISVRWAPWTWGAWFVCVCVWTGMGQKEPGSTGIGYIWQVMPGQGLKRARST